MSIFSFIFLAFSTISFCVAYSIPKASDVDELEASLIPSIDQLPSFSSKVGSMRMPLENFLDLYEIHNQYYFVLLGSNGYPRFALKLKECIKQSLKLHFNDQVNDLIKPDYVLEYVLSAMIGIMSYWFNQNKNISKETLILI